MREETESPDERVVERLRDCGAMECHKLRLVAEGVTAQVKKMDYEDWVRPLKLTGGRVCLRVGDDLGHVYLKWTAEDKIVQKPHNFEFDRGAELPPSHVAALINTHFPHVTPVPVEATPFAEADDA